MGNGNQNGYCSLSKILDGRKKFGILFNVKTKTTEIFLVFFNLIFLKVCRN